MSRTASVALLVGLLLATVPGQAQDAAPTPLLDDGLGDAMLVVQGTQAGSANAVYPAVDLVALSLAERPAEFIWTLEVNDLRAGNEESGADGVRYAIEFEHNARFFRLRVSFSLPTLSSDRAFAVLDSRDSPDGQWSNVWASETAVLDFAQDTVTTTVPREALADLDGAVPFPGRTLEGIHVTATSGFSGSSVNIVGRYGVPQDIRDEMPDAGDDFASYAVLVGVVQTGNARLASLQPFRASNGEATTFVFEVEAINLGEENDTYELVVSGVPTRLGVVLPVNLLTIGPGESMQVPVLATIPFGHQHGGVDRFLLELISLSDPTSVGRLEMGVRYLEVPQPAGHHDTVWLHLPQTGGANQFVAFQEGFMNTLENDDRGGPGPWHATGFSGGIASYTSSWSLGLSPGLEMGLDLDLDRLGAASIPIGTTLPLTGASLEGVLYVAYGIFNDEVPVASFASAPVDIPAQGKHVYELEITPFEESDVIPFEAGRNLWLDLRLTYALTPSPLLGFASDTPALLSGGYMRLPLNEYHDAVDDALAAVDGPSLTTLGPQERLVNPGEAVVYTVSVSNPTNESVSMRLAVTGSQVAWATLVNDALRVPANGSANVTLIVRAPADALDGDRADLILQAYARDVPNARGLLRLVTEVDTAADHVDDSPAAAQELKKKDTPAMPLAGLLALLVALVAARRR